MVASLPLKVPHTSVPTDLFAWKHMPLVTTQPEALAIPAGALQGTGSAANAANAAAAAPTAGVVPAAGDQVSALVTAQFTAHAGSYRAVSSQAAGIHQQPAGRLGGHLRFLRLDRGCQRNRCHPSDKRGVYAGAGRGGGVG